MTQEQTSPSGPDLTQGVALADLVDGRLVGHVGNEEVLLVQAGSELFAIGAKLTLLPGRWFTSVPLRLTATLLIVHQYRSMIRRSCARGRRLFTRGDASIVMAVLASSGPNFPKDCILTLPTLKR